eukprot:scaffold21246_cov110-Isochrysis_galbana.AAC.7
MRSAQAQHTARAHAACVSVTERAVTEKRKKEKERPRPRQRGTSTSGHTTRSRPSSLAQFSVSGAVL